MSHKTPKIATLIADCQGYTLDPHYLGFFDCFNQQLYFEAHEVLEELWLDDRHGPDGDFYKGLIQLAGAFVHLQKTRPGPAVALFKLAQANLTKYPAVHQELRLTDVLNLIGDWLFRLSDGTVATPTFDAAQAPHLSVPRNRRSENPGVCQSRGVLRRGGGNA